MLTGMGRNSAISVLIAAVIAVVSGCDSVSGVDPMESRDSPVTTSAAPATTADRSTSVPTTSVPTGELASATLPPCPDSGEPIPDCALRSDDSAGLTFEVRRTGTRREGELTIDIVTPEGIRAQTITEDGVDIDWSLPRLADTDADGRDELIVPLLLAAYQARYVVYHASGEAVEFTRAGEFAGLGIEPTPDGYTVTSGELSGYQGRFHEFWVYEADELIPVITVENQYIYDDPRTKIIGTECVVAEAPGLSRTGFSSRAAAREHFCAQPVVLE